MQPLTRRLRSFRRLGWFLGRPVAPGILGALLGLLGNLLAKRATLLANVRSRLRRATRRIRIARAGWFARIPGFAGVGWFAGVLGLAGIGGFAGVLGLAGIGGFAAVRGFATVRGFPAVIRLAAILGLLVRFSGGGRLRRFRQRNLAHDLVGHLGIRIDDDAHGDVQVITFVRGWRLREHPRNGKQQRGNDADQSRTPHDALASHAVSPLPAGTDDVRGGAMTCIATLTRRVFPWCSISATMRPSPVSRAITGSESRLAPGVSVVCHSTSCCWS